MSLPIPMWLLYLVMPLGFLLVCLRLVQCTVKIAGQIRQGGIEADKIEEEKGERDVSCCFVCSVPGTGFLGSTHWLCIGIGVLGSVFTSNIISLSYFVRAMANSVDSFTLTAVPFLCWQDRLCQRQESQKVCLKPLMYGWAG